MLIDPTDGITEPNMHLLFSWDAYTGIASVYGRDERGKEVEQIFDLNGLNGRKELIKARSNYVKKLAALLKYAQIVNEETIKREAIQILKDASQSDAPYLAFVLTHITPYIP
jgi:hypothetical protein